PFDGRPDILDSPPMVSPLNDDFVTDLGELHVDRGHREDFPEVSAVDGSGGKPDFSAVFPDVIRVREETAMPGGSGWHVDGFIAFARSQERSVDVDDIFRLAAQRRN